MSSSLRKFYIWFVSFLIVIIAYLLYSRYSGTPPIDINEGAGMEKSIADSDTGSGVEDMGQVGGVQVGSVRQAQFYDLDEETKKVVREFDFEELLHIEGKQWELNNPRINIYKPDFACYITADKGKVIIEDAVGNISPKDAALRGNVVLRIVPTDSNNISESFLYLDNLDYRADESKILTSGPVRFVSEDVRLNGRGMELVYNEQKEYLEYLRINYLDNLRISSEETSILSSSRDQKKRAEKSRVKREGDKHPLSEQKAPHTNKERQKEPEYYKCELRENVIVDTPEQVIATDEISITNILYSSGSEKKAKDKPAGEKVPMYRDANIEEKTSPAPKGKVSDWPAERRESFDDIVVSCENGITVTPMGSYSKADSLETGGNQGGVVNFRKEEIIKRAQKRAAFITPVIDYDASTGDTFAGGESVLRFYVEDVGGAAANVPVEVTATEKVSFLRGKGEVVFEGDCVCSAVQEEVGIQRKHLLSAERIVVYLAEREGQSSESAKIEHITADGDIVKLSTLKKKDGQMLAGVQLNCKRFDYDTESKSYLATGPGVIKVDNSEISEPNEKESKYSLRRRCFALIENFDTLEYLMESNLIIADARRGRINIGYAPVIQNEYGPVTKMDAGRVKVKLQQTPDGRFEISQLYALQGIRCERQDIEFEGSRMIYESGDSIVRAEGNDTNPCLLNGALVEGIQHNVKTGKTRTKVVGPGIFQIGK